MILQVHDLRKYYNAFCALDGVSFHVKAGGFCPVGPNGAGKSTLVNVLTGLLKPSAGRVYFKQQHITGLAPACLARLGMARSFQLVSIFPELTVLEVWRRRWCHGWRKGRGCLPRCSGTVR